MDSMENNEIVSNQYDKIDLVAFFIKLKSLWYVVVIGALIGTLLASIYSTFLTTPMYESSAMVYIRGSSKSISLQDLQLGAELTKDYEIIFKSRPNLEKVISKLNLEYDVETLTKMISISNPSDTRILQVSVTSIDASLSKEIANEVVNYGMDSIREIDSQEPYLVEKAIAKNKKVGASFIKMAATGMLLGIVTALGIIFIRFVLSDEIKSIEDVERVLELPVLAVVVEDKALSYTKKKSQKKKWR